MSEFENGLNGGEHQGEPGGTEMHTEMPERPRVSDPYVTGTEGGFAPHNGGSSMDQRKKSKTPILIGAVLVLAVMIGVGYFFLKPALGNPFNRLVKAWSDMYAEREHGMDIFISASFDKNHPDFKFPENSMSSPMGSMTSSPEQLKNFIAEVVPNFKIKYSVDANTKKDKLGGGASVSLMYKDGSLVDLGGFFKLWDARIFSDALFSKPLILDIAAAVKKERNIDLSKLHIGDYVEVLYEKDDFIKNFRSSEYMKELEAFVKDKVKSKGSNQLVLTIKSEDSLTLMKKLTAIAEKDEKIKKSFETKFMKILDMVKDNKDYEVFGITEEMFNMQYNFAKENMKTGIDELFGELSKTYSSDRMNMGMYGMKDGETTAVYTLKGDKIDKVESSLTAGFVSLNFELKMRDYKEPAAVSLKNDQMTDLIDGFEDPSDVEAEEFSKSVLENFKNNVLQGSAFKAMTDDISSIAKKTLSEQDAKVINQGLSMIPSLADMYLQYGMPFNFLPDMGNPFDPAKFNLP